ncbi:hypothetical protein [Nonomuraea sp. 10N515B]|uniref:hypothetical protein n=1 Tax=Nonomuraea sp. 10N515B TaxID=3457422 RepID=UPI003FCDEC8B
MSGISGGLPRYFRAERAVAVDKSVWWVVVDEVLGCRHEGPHVHVHRRLNANGAFAKARQPRAIPVERDSARHRVWITRNMRSGHGDEFSFRDAMSAARAAMTSVKDMHRATTFEAAANPHSIARKEFATMAQAADECITKVAGLDTAGEEAVRRENTSLLTQMIADLEARLTEPSAG